ncbi:hypothetical protein TNCT_260421 [Trichonephila clavata]|uniref:Uncharacterized protein n=1 Tax=Trichonephila clavata TaxID=2740835 RepID=A0A8X6GL55_TRICU|nr:hypothetical protein TNCT_260421 [Trichonephila clavata]
MRIIRKELEEARLGVSQQTELSSSSVAERELTASEPDVAEQTWNIRLGLGNKNPHRDSDKRQTRLNPGRSSLAQPQTDLDRRIFVAPWCSSLTASRNASPRLKKKSGARSTSGLLSLPHPLMGVPRKATEYPDVGCKVHRQVSRRLCCPWPLLDTGSAAPNLIRLAI